MTAPALSWFLAEGATGGFFDSFVLIANPESDRGDVRRSRYLCRTGATLTKTYTVAANSRFTIYVDDESPGGSGRWPMPRCRRRDVDQRRAGHRRARDVVAGPTRDWHEAHNSPGATATGTRWALADGEVGGAHGTQT